MSSFKLSLPTDIPWKRICVSSDMLDPIPCDAERPAKWQSSLAVFRYDPSEEYQGHDGYLISYLKVSVTVTPYAPEIDVERAGKYVAPVLVSDLEEAFPCYGAILQLGVAPTKDDRGNYDAYEFPFFMDFEPKKRELYEAVTDTGEMLSASSASLSVGKSAGTSDSTEAYNLDMGWNFGMNASYAGTGGGMNVGDKKQVGDVYKTGLQRQDIRTSEEGIERRERQSHVTQLTQMYNLFQAFHLGTNRGVFFMEPRPHIRQSEATFINGPRALEGIQDVFLVVARPDTMDDFCVSALLETAHLTKEPVYEYEKTSDILQFRLFAKAQNKDTSSGETDWVETVTKTETYMPPPGWQIDELRSGGYDYTILRQQRRQQGPTFNVSPNTLSVYGEVTWRFWETGFWNDNHYEDGYLDVDVTIYLKRKDPELVEYIEKLFLTARDLCCCADHPVSVPGQWVAWAEVLPPKCRVQLYNGFANRKRFAESRQLASAVRTGMVRSLASSRRIPRGKVDYEHSEMFFDRVVNLMAIHRPTKAVSLTVEKAKVLSKQDRTLIHEKLGSVTVRDLTRLGTIDLSRALDIGVDEATAMKERLARDLAKQPRKVPDDRRQPSGGDPSNEVAADIGDLLGRLIEEGHITDDQVRRMMDKLLDN